MIYNILYNLALVMNRAQMRALYHSSLTVFIERKYNFFKRKILFFIDLYLLLHDSSAYLFTDKSIMCRHVS